MRLYFNGEWFEEGKDFEIEDDFINPLLTFNYPCIYPSQIPIPSIEEIHSCKFLSKEVIEKLTEFIKSTRFPTESPILASILKYSERGIFSYLDKKTREIMDMKNWLKK